MQVIHLSHSPLTKKQFRIDRFGSLEGAHIDNQINEGIQISDGSTVADSGTLDTQSFSLAVNALTGSALDVDRPIQRATAIHQHTSAAPRLVIDVFLTPFAFEKLLMFAGLGSFFRKEQGTPVALSAIAVGVLEG